LYTGEGGFRPHAITRTISEPQLNSFIALVSLIDMYDEAGKRNTQLQPNSPQFHYRKGSRLLPVRAAMKKSVAAHEITTAADKYGKLARFRMTRLEISFRRHNHDAIAAAQADLSFVPTTSHDHRPELHLSTPWQTVNAMC
jgi:hypothetical protein